LARCTLKGEESKLSSDQKLRRVDEIFPGAGATITNLARFGDWERWGYDWHLDVEPALLAIAQCNGPSFLPVTLTYFDKPIVDIELEERTSSEIVTAISEGYADAGKASRGA
jgi:hypothetical protein